MISEVSLPIDSTCSICDKHIKQKGRIDSLVEKILPPRPSSPMVTHCHHFFHGKCIQNWYSIGIYSQEANQLLKKDLQKDLNEVTNSINKLKDLLEQLKYPSIYEDINQAEMALTQFHTMFSILVDVLKVRVSQNPDHQELKKECALNEELLENIELSLKNLNLVEFINDDFESMPLLKESVSKAIIWIEDTITKTETQIQEISKNTEEIEKHERCPTCKTSLSESSIPTYEQCHIKWIETSIKVIMCAGGCLGALLTFVASTKLMKKYLELSLILAIVGGFAGARLSATILHRDTLSIATYTHKLSTLLFLRYHGLKISNNQFKLA